VQQPSVDGATPQIVSRKYAESLDAADPLAGLAAEFDVPDPDLCYLDGNSLGRPPRRSLQRARQVLEQEWADGLIRSWSHWITDAVRVGDLIGATMLGAAPGQMLLSDTTTANVYKLTSAALDWHAARTPSGGSPRRALVTDTANFPTNRYVLEGIAAARGAELRRVVLDEVEPATVDALASVLDESVAVVQLSLVDYRSAAVADLVGVTRAAHDVGALVLWDLCHAVGAIPVELDAAGVDLAVGCTYKYLNGGPGAPAFLYVRRDLQDEMRQPIWGWFGQREQFAMGERYDPAPGIARFATGTPSAVGAALVEAGTALLAEVGVEALAAKGAALTDYLIALVDTRLASYGFAVRSPRDARVRGSHVSLAHPEAYRICQAMIARGVVPDFRGPDRLRLGLAPATTSYADVWHAVDVIADIVESGAHLQLSAERAAVT
jgi:kynureninase